MPVYSFSQIRVFDQCPLKYRYQYIDKLPKAAFVMSPDLLLGSAVHFALEKLYKQLNQFQTPTLQQTIWRAKQYWSDNKWDAMEFSEEKPEKNYLKRAEIYLTQYYSQHQPFEWVKIVMTEWNIVFSLDEAEGIKFRGVIDRLDKRWSTFIINDYKTNKHLPTEDAEHYKEQLTLYALGVKEKYGKYFEYLEARLYYLHFELVDEWNITNKDIERVSNKYKNTVKNVEQKRFYFNMWNKEVFQPQENNACKRCDYMSICPLRTHMHMDDEVVVGEDTIKTILAKYVEVSDKMNSLKRDKESLKEIIVAYMKAKQVKRLFGDTHELSQTHMTTYAIKDPQKLQALLEDMGYLEKLTQIDKYALSRAIKDGDLEISWLHQCVEEKVSPVLRVKKS